MMKGTHHTALQKREVRLNFICSSIAPLIFTFGMADDMMAAVKFFAYAAIRTEFVRHDRRGLVYIFSNSFLQILRIHSF